MLHLAGDKMENLTGLQGVFEKAITQHLMEHKQQTFGYE